MNPKDVVRIGYDKVSHAYRTDGFDYDRSGYKTYLSWLEPRLRPGASILDLGCGCGVPVAQVLSRQHHVTGVDISPVQIERARKLVPTARFICTDMATLDVEPDSLDSIVAFYSIIHVPLDEQPRLFVKLARWLKPGGHLLASVGHTNWTGTEVNWRGVEGATMYWSHGDARMYRGWLEQVGLVILEEGFLPEGEGGHTILLGHKSEEIRTPTQLKNGTI
jgi:SAM-dependent methyltransferase